MVLSASRSARMTVAALVWTMVGVGLVAAGSWYLAPQADWAFWPAGLFLGWLKGRFLLAPMARENAARIAAGPTRTWLVDAFAPSAWMVALFFMVLGFLLRRVGLPGTWIGLAYLAAGTGLLLASGSAWSAFRRFRSGNTEP